jgi:hypothetical protein
MVQGGLAKAGLVCLCLLALIATSATSAGATMYFGATISAETYGQTGNAPRSAQAWDLFERHAGRKVAILNQGQLWTTFDKVEADATHARGAIPLVTMGLGSAGLEEIAKGGQDAAIKKWAQEAKAWGHPFLFAPWWEMNGGWYPWGRSPSFIPAWRHFHDLVVAEGATNVTWTWVVNSIWSDPESDPAPYYPGDAYVDWTGLDTYNWGRNPAQPDKWINPEQTITPTLKIIREVAPSKPLAIVETASSEFGGNKTDWVRELLTTYLPHHPEIKAFLWFNWNFLKGANRADWPIESSAPAQQEFRKAIQSSVFVPGPVALPNLTKVPPPPVAAAGAAQPRDISATAEMASGPDVALAPDGTATTVWSARSGGTFGVFARRFAPDGTPGPTRQLSAVGGDALQPQVAVAPDGTATVVWIRWEGANSRIQARRISPGGTPAEATLTLSGANQNAMSPQLGLAADGEATVVWKRFDGFHYLVQVRQIAADGTAGQPAQRLSESGQDAVEPAVAVAADGTATVVWSRFDGSDSVVQERRVEPAGTLGASTTILSAGGESAVRPQVALGPQGAATVIWNRFDGANWVVQAQRLTAGGVPAGSVFDLSAAGRSAAEPQLAIDAGGVATAVWDRYDGSSFVVQARQISAAGNLFAAPVQLSAGGRDAVDPAVATGPDGRATVLWSRFDGANWIVQRRDLAPGGVPASTEGLSTAGRNAGDSVLAWASGGTLTMAWKRFNGGGDVVQAQTVPRPDLPPPPPPPPPAGEAGGSGGGDRSLQPAPTLAANSFTIDKVRLNRRRGTANLTVAVPGSGLVAVDGALPQQRQVDGAGRVTLAILPKPKARRILLRRGSVRLRLTVTFAPRGGLPSSRDLSLRLKKELPG